LKPGTNVSGFFLYLYRSINKEENMSTWETEFWETMCPEADKAVGRIMEQLSKEELTIIDAFKALDKVAYDYPDADICKETINKFMDHAELITHYSAEECEMAYQAVQWITYGAGVSSLTFNMEILRPGNTNYVSFFVAKLLKFLGYNALCGNYYMGSGKFFDFERPANHNAEMSKHKYSAPTPIEARTFLESKGVTFTED
jgi:hypothetical protein